MRSLATTLATCPVFWVHLNVHLKYIVAVQTSILNSELIYKENLKGLKPLPLLAFKLQRLKKAVF